MKQMIIIISGILVFLFHTLNAVDSYTSYQRMCSDNIDSILVGAEGHFYFKDQAMFDTIAHILMIVIWKRAKQDAAFSFCRPVHLLKELGYGNQK